MTSILRLLVPPLLILCGGIVSCVEAFSSSSYYGCRRRLLMHCSNDDLGHGVGIPVGTKLQPLGGNGVDYFGVAIESSYLSPGYFEAYPTLEETLRLFYYTLPKVHGKFPFIPKNYVARPALEDEILQRYQTSYDDKVTGSYTIIVGTKGAGKSSVIAHTLGKKPGVLYIRMTNADTWSPSLGNKLVEASGQVFHEKLKLSVDDIRPLFEQIAITGHPITIVLDVVPGTGASYLELLGTVRSTAKDLAQVANIIIDLSDANAVQAFGDDRRHEFIWVDGMTHEEATTYAKKLFPEINDHDLMTFLEKVGTLPHDVRSFVASVQYGKPANVLIQAAVYGADRDLADFLHQPIVEALKVSPDGVCTIRFDGVEDNGVRLVEPKDVAVAMLKSKAIVYHLPSREYRLASRAHRSALLEVNNYDLLG